LQPIRSSELPGPALELQVETQGPDLQRVADPRQAFRRGQLRDAARGSGKRKREAGHGALLRAARRQASRERKSNASAARPRESARDGRATADSPAAAPPGAAYRTSGRIIAAR